MEIEKTQGSQNSFEKNKIGRLTLSYFKTY